MKTVIFKSNKDRVSYINDLREWLETNDDLVIVNESHFFDRIDETFTVVVSYYYN